MHRNGLVALAVITILVFESMVPSMVAASNPVLVYSGLNFPVSFRFTPDGRILFNERTTGNIRVIQSGIILPTPFATLAVATDGPEQGLLGMALDPDFATNGFVYVYRTVYNGSYYHGLVTRLNATENTGVNPVTIFDVTNPSPGNLYHNGGYLKFGPDRRLYAQVGEFQNQQLAQNLSSNAGKILRMNADGTVPIDNPYRGSLVYAYGIRNGFGMDFDPTNGNLIETEAGPASNDEINVIVPKGNYGWPNCSGRCTNTAYVDPIATFTPVVTPTGIAYSSGGEYFFGEWTGTSLNRLKLNSSGAVQSIEQISPIGATNDGVLDVVLGPDQKIYFSTRSGIYSYDTSFPGGTGPPFAPNISSSLISFGLIAIGISATIIFVLFFQRRRKRSESRQPVCPTKSKALLTLRRLESQL